MSDAVNPLAYFDDHMTEAEVCERYSHLLSERELRQARRNGAIDFTTGKKGMISYHPAAVAKYLEQKVTRCQRQQSGSGNMASTGSGTSQIPITSTPAGGISGQNEHVVEVLTRKFLPKRETA